MDLTDEVKAMINGMSYGRLLEFWRYAPAGEPMFQGESGQYYAEVMRERRNALPEGAHATISKALMKGRG